MPNKEITCIVCPLSCQVVLELGGEAQILAVRGNKCPRGEVYARKEHQAPERTLTTTIRVRGGQHPLLPVRTSAPIPKGAWPEAMQFTAGLEVSAPVLLGAILVENFLGLGVDLIASRDLSSQT